VCLRTCRRDVNRRQMSCAFAVAPLRTHGHHQIVDGSDAFHQQRTGTREYRNAPACPRLQAQAIDRHLGIANMMKAIGAFVGLQGLETALLSTATALWAKTAWKTIRPRTTRFSPSAIACKPERAHGGQDYVFTQPGPIADGRYRAVVFAAAFAA